MVRILHLGVRLAAAIVIAAASGSCGSAEGPTGTSTPVETTIRLSASTLSFDALGDDAVVVATVLDQSGAPMSDAEVIWSSSDAAVVTVSPQGTVYSRGNGTAKVTADAGLASAVISVTVTQIPATVSLASSVLLLDAAGDTMTLLSIVKDSNSNPLAAPSVTWTSSNEGVVTVSDFGLVTALSEGVSTVTGAAGVASASIEVYVGDATPVITDVQPAVLIEGEAATVVGAGFTGTPSTLTVSVGGLAAQVTSATATQVQFIVPQSDCRPAHQANLVLEPPIGKASRIVDVVPQTVWSFALGEGAYTTEGCLHLNEASGAQRYVIGILSTSETPSSLTPTILSSEAVATVSLAAPARSIPPVGAGSISFDFKELPRPTRATQVAGYVASPISATPGRSGEEGIRELERNLFESLGPTSARDVGAARSSMPAPPNIGEVIQLNVPLSCTTAVSVDAVVRHVGPAGVWLEDVDNPIEAFTLAEYQTFDQVLSTYTLPAITNYFGNFVDVDANGRLMVLLTKEVNKMENLNGFVFGVDLVPRSTCPISNQAEIFYGYVPDPAGVYGRVLTKQEVSATYHPLIAHEATHVLQFTQQFYLGAGGKSTWELEGGATLAEQLVGYRILGHGPGLDLGRAQYEAGAEWYRDWAVDLAYYFGYSGSGKIPGTPEQCSWTGRPTEGNNGPCLNSGRAVYGVPSTLLRYVLDDYGPTFPGGEAALMRALTSSSFEGLGNLADATGDDAALLLTRFGIALWADGRLGDWLTSWNIYDVLQGFGSEAQLAPYTTVAANPSLSVSVRSGSTAYLEWSPPVSHAATSLRIRNAFDGALPDYMVLWALRIQ